MKIFWNILKYFGILAATTGVLFKSFQYFEGMRDEIQEVQSTVDEVNVHQSVLSKRISTMQDTIDKISAENKKQSRDIGSLVWGMKHQKEFTPDQFEEILNELLKKKSSHNPRPPILQENGFENITSHTSAKSKPSH